MSQNPNSFALRGGMDLASPALMVKAGRARVAINYESTEQGYERRMGFERFDGRPSPSEAHFTFIRFRNRTGALVLGATITGQTSGATARIGFVFHEPAIPGVEILMSSTSVFMDSTTILMSSTETAAADPLRGFLILLRVTGTFQNGETLLIGGVPVAIAASAPFLDQALTTEEEQSFALIAANDLRADILAVPGTGFLRGLGMLRDRLYAWRNDGLGFCRMYRSTPTGWEHVDLGHTINFTAGTAEISEGQLITQGGVTARVRRVVVRTGVWGGVPQTGGPNTDFAAGSLTLSEISGGNFAAGIATTSGGSATLSGAETAITIPALTSNNTVRATAHNFGAREALYVATGMGPAYEFDGNYTTPIRTGLSDSLEKPTLVAKFSNHLFLLYRDGAVTFSDIGDPLVFDAAAGGAGTFQIGSVPLEVVEDANTTMMIIGRSALCYFIGQDAETFELKTISSEAGGWARSGQNIGRALYVDQLGLRDLTANDSLAGFAMGTLSRDIASTFKSYEAGRAVPLCTLRCKVKNQVRIYYDDGTGICASFSNSMTKPEFTLFDLPIVASCALGDPVKETEQTFAGQERMFLGGRDGFVYQVDKGTSDDGAAFKGILRLPFNLLGSPERDKRFHSFAIDIEAKSTAKIWISAEFDYSDGERVSGAVEELAAYGGGGYWDEAVWDEFNWDGPTSSTLTGRIDGVAASVSLLIRSESATEQPHTLTTCRLNWTLRRYRR